VIALNLSTTKASVEKSSAAARELLEAKDPQDFFAKSTARVPNLDGLFAYNRELFSIASKTQAELFQAAQEQIEGSRQARRASTEAVCTDCSASASASPSARTEGRQSRSQASAKGRSKSRSQARGSGEQA